MSKYVGITIGPIVVTICEATSPMALWFASTMFSDITRRLCVALDEEYGIIKGTDAELLSPSFDENDRNGLKDGMGKYHDRIIFSVREIDEKVLKDLILKVKKETMQAIGVTESNAEEPLFSEKEYADGETYLEQYLQIHYVILDEADIGEENPLLAIGPYLDRMELMYKFPESGRDNPIWKIFAGSSEEKKNDYLKKSNLFRALSNKGKCMICNESGNVRSIEQIADAANGKGNKYKSYFAVVNADADGMGDFLKSLSAGDSGRIEEFSRRCLTYDMKAAELIRDFGGMPIYAGGDDLLFLAPVVSKKDSRETVLRLCGRISETFKQIMTENNGFEESVIPTVSYGISMQYKKYPLYEALSNSRAMLGTAKDKDRTGKDCIVFRLEKHSGQTIGEIIGNEALNDAEEILDVLTDTDAEAIKSVGTTLEQFRSIATQIDNVYIENVAGRTEKPWNNLFDNNGQMKAAEYLKKLQKWYFEKMLTGKLRIKPLYDSEQTPKNVNLDAFLALLRMGKFLVEKGDE